MPRTRAGTPGRRTMAWRTTSRAAGLLGLAGLLLSAATPPAPAQGKVDQVVPGAAGHDAQGPGEKAHAKDHAAEHKPTAAEEVEDRRGKDENDEPEPWYILHVFGLHLPLVGWFKIGGYWVPTKYMWLMLIAALLTFFIYRGLARRVQNGEVPRGPFWNFFESLLTFIREDVA